MGKHEEWLKLQYKLREDEGTKESSACLSSMDIQDLKSRVEQKMCDAEIRDSVPSTNEMNLKSTLAPSFRITCSRHSENKNKGVLAQIRWTDSRSPSWEEQVIKQLPLNLTPHESPKAIKELKEKMRPTDEPLLIDCHRDFWQTGKQIRKYDSLLLGLSAACLCIPTAAAAAHWFEVSRQAVEYRIEPNDAWIIECLVSERIAKQIREEDGFCFRWRE